MKKVKMLLLLIFSLILINCGGSDPANPNPSPQPVPNAELKGTYVLSGDFGATSNAPILGTSKLNTTSWHTMEFGNAPVGYIVEHTQHNQNNNRAFAFNDNALVSVLAESTPEDMNMVIPPKKEPI